MSSVFAIFNASIDINSIDLVYLISDRLTFIRLVISKQDFFKVSIRERPQDQFNGLPQQAFAYTWAAKQT